MRGNLTSFTLLLPLIRRFHRHLPPGGKACIAVGSVVAFPEGKACIAVGSVTTFHRGVTWDVASHYAYRFIARQKFVAFNASAGFSFFAICSLLLNKPKNGLTNDII